MFDPFKDFETEGYLRNRLKEKDPEIVMEAEHEMFRRFFDDALTYLSHRQELTYEDFLEVHRVLFGNFYPWAGLDRGETSPRLAISKHGTYFCHPNDCRRAVQEGLRLGSDAVAMRRRHGEVMGLFAYGHPFLDGNGRTMLVVHTELCHRAGFAIDWTRTVKRDYLRALSSEISSPGKGILDNYLEQFITVPEKRAVWRTAICALPGLNGTNQGDTVEGDINDPFVSMIYRAFDEQRGYRIG